MVIEDGYGGCLRSDLKRHNRWAVGGKILLPINKIHGNQQKSISFIQSRAGLHTHPTTYSIMNVKSITDLDDILINETETYNDDDFDDESPPPKPNNVSSQSKKVDAEYDDDGFEADSEVHSLEEREEIWEDEIAPQVAPPTPIANDVVPPYVPASAEIISVPSIANFTPATPEPVTSSSSSSRRAAETILEAGLTVRNESQTAWPETQRSTVSSRIILPEPAPPIFTHLRMTGQKGVDCRVSHVQLVSEEERYVLTSGLHTKTNRKPTKSSTNEREDTLRALEEMLLVAAERVEKRVASEHMLSSRSVPVVGGWVVPQLPNAKDPLSFVGANVGIPDYDPDYDVAVEMAQRRLIQPSYHTTLSQPHGNSRGGTNLTTIATSSSSSSSSSSSGNHNVPSSSSSNLVVGGVTVIKNNNYDNHHNDSEEFVRTTLAQQERRQRREKESSSFPPHSTASFTGTTVDAREMAQKLIDDINDQKVSSELLRLGINRPQLQDQSEVIYSTFLSDIMELCKTRAASSSSIEEIAMHRALATYVHEFFVPAHQIKKARARMVEVAVESSLKYIPVQKTYPTTTSPSDVNNAGVKGSGEGRTQRRTPTSSSGGGGSDRGTKMTRTTAQRRNKDNKSTTMRSSLTTAPTAATESAYRHNINNTRGLILREERIGGQR